MTDEATEKSSFNMGRIALILAGLLALGAVGVQLYKTYGGSGEGASEQAARRSGAGAQRR